MISIIVPAYNAGGTIGECIRACLGQDHASFEVIVVDDGSTDETARIVAGYPIHYVRQENGGPASARNRGAFVARGDLLAFTDADCVPSREWLSTLARAMEEGGADAAGGTYEMAGPERLLSRMVHEEILARHEKMNGHVDFLGSFNMMVRAAAFRDVGGFDEGFRSASGEDNDLAYRLQDAGYRLVFVPGAPVAHHHPARMWPYLRTQSRHGFWRVRLYKKHAGRSRGDRYAGVADFARPPIALLSLALLPMALWGPATSGALAVALIALVLFTAPMTLRVCRRTGNASMLCLFPGMMVLRDYARGLGMAGGFWHFIVRGRE